MNLQLYSTSHINNNNMVNLTFPKYIPNYLIVQTHNLEHKNFQGEKISNTFNITYQTNWNNVYSTEYIQSIIYLPYLIFAILFLLLIIFFIVLCCRFCLKWCNCQPNYDVDKITQPEVMKNYYNTVNLLTRIFIITCIVVVIADELIFTGSHHLDLGYNMGQDSLNFFYNSFDQLTNLGQQLELNGLLINNNILLASSTTCPSAYNMLNTSIDYNNDIQDYINLINPMTGKINSYHNFLTKFAFTWKNVIIFSFWGIVIFLVICFSLSIYYQSKLTLRLHIVWVSMLIIFIWGINAGEMSALVNYFFF